MGRRFFYTGSFLTWLILYSSLAFSQQPLILEDEEVSYTLDSSHFVEVFQSGPEQFVPASKINHFYLHNPNTEKSYWFKFDVKNAVAEEREWLMVSYNYSIDEIDVWIQTPKGTFEKHIFRDSMDLKERTFLHKQPVFVIKLRPEETKTLYVRIRNQSSYDYVFAFFSHSGFYAHFFKEYLWYGLFYGFMLFVLLYSVLNAVFFKNGVIMLYTWFIACQIVHMMYRDATGLFIFPFYPEHADLFRNVSRTLLTVFLILYTTYFVKINHKSWLYKGILIFVGVKLASTMFLEDGSRMGFHIEMFSILFSTVLSIRSYLRGNEEAKYMCLGLSVLTVSYFIYYLSKLGVSSFSTFGFFALYYGIALESIFMTIALTERFKKIRIDNYRKAQMNRELEKLVQERTETIRIQNKLLEDQAKELNLFLYSASHDLKGPLKTILGLCNMGVMDKEADHLRIYDLIKNKLRNLESNINDLNLVTNLKNADGSNTCIDFESLHKDIMQRFAEVPGVKEMNIRLHLDLKHNFIADIFPIRCVYQNIFENAVKFRDESRDSFLKISIVEKDQWLTLTFEDNGEGIDKKHVPYIFNMFYRASEKSKEDTGLGLYIVKLAVLRMRGEIFVESDPDKGTKIIIRLPINPDTIIHSLLNLKKNLPLNHRHKGAA